MRKRRKNLIGAFHALVDKVWREDFLLTAWGMVRRNGGAAGVDGVTVADIGAHGVERWVGELSRDLRDGTYKPSPVRQVLIPKKQPGKFRPLGIPCMRDRVAQDVGDAGAVADLRGGPGAGAVRIPAGTKRQGRGQADPSLLHTGRNEVIDGDLSNYFGELPHAELMKSVARRVSGGRMLGLIKAWLEMPVVEEDGEGGSRRTNRARKGPKGDSTGSSDLAAIVQHTWSAMVHPLLDVSRLETGRRRHGSSRVVPVRAGGHR